MSSIEERRTPNSRKHFPAPRTIFLRSSSFPPSFPPFLSFGSAGELLAGIFLPKTGPVVSLTAISCMMHDCCAECKPRISPVVFGEEEQHFGDFSGDARLGPRDATDGLRAPRAGLADPEGPNGAGSFRLGNGR